jgi:hypothetical protein
MRFTFLFLLSIFVVACGETPEVAEEDYGDEAEVAAEDAATVAERTDGLDLLQQTAAAVQRAGGDITAFPLSAATNNINAWITKLADVEGADPIVADLARLKDELLRTEIDRMRVAGILSSLANDTGELADEAPGLSALSDALREGANRLSGEQ